MIKITFRPLTQAALAATLLIGGCGVVDDLKSAIKDGLKEQAEKLALEGLKSFPIELAVGSPIEITAAVAAAFSPLNEHENAPRPSYHADSARIQAMLVETADIKHCHFDPGMLIRPSRNAKCYGPHVTFEGHPDATDSTSAIGSLPHGDVGMWTDIDAPTGEACSAAQINAGLDSVGRVSTGALMGLASLVCTAHVNKKSIDESNLDLLTDMNALGMPHVTFKTALIKKEGSKYKYSLAFDFTPKDMPHNISVEMEHSPGAVTEAYNGNVWYRVKGPHTDMHSRCPEGKGARLGTLKYDRQTANELGVEVRSGEYCGDADGRGADGSLDAANKQTLENNGGWQNMFSILKGDYNPKALTGDYSYAWQAGTHDGHSRSFSMKVGQDGEKTTGEAYFGYGDDIAGFAGIKGFICNWAGPHGPLVNAHDYKPFVQSQKIERTGTGKFTVVESHIKYAPTIACDYDGAIGTFTFDTDGDGVVDSDPNVDYANSLLPIASMP